MKCLFFHLQSFIICGAFVLENLAFYAPSLFTIQSEIAHLIVNIMSNAFTIFITAIDFLIVFLFNGEIRAQLLLLFKSNSEITTTSDRFYSSFGNDQNKCIISPKYRNSENINVSVIKTKSTSNPTTRLYWTNHVFQNVFFVYNKRSYKKCKGKKLMVKIATKNTTKECNKKLK